jgi:spermidine/putrescine transport system permease protein
VRRWPRLIFLAVPLLWVAAAHVGPLIAMARISAFATYPGPPGAAATWSAAAYAAFLHGPGYRASLLHSLALATATTAVSLLLAYPLAYHVALRVAPARRGRRLMLLVAPFWTSEVLRMFAIVLLLANRGALNALLRWAGLTRSPIPLLYGTGAVLAGVVYTVLLSMLLPLYAALDQLPPDLLEAASDLGAGAWSRFWRVTLPLTARGVASGTILTFLASLGVFAAPALLGGAGTPTFATTIVDLFGAASGRWPMGAAFGFILLLAGTACAVGLAALAPGLRRTRPT